MMMTCREAQDAEKHLYLELMFRNREATQQQQQQQQQHVTPPPSDLVAFVHQALYGAEQGAVASHRHQDLLHGVDVALAHLSIDLRESIDQGRVTLHSPTGRRQRAN